MKIKILIKYILIACLIFCTTYYLCAQDFKLSDRAKDILNKFEQLENNIDSDEIWNNYLKIFPSTNKDFKNIFDPDDFSELYNNSHQYILILENAPESLINEVINLIFNITKTNSPGCCDAWSYLNMITMIYANNSIQIFIKNLKKYNQQEIEQIIKFMADKEAIKFSKDFQNLVDKLKSIKEYKLAGEFEQAREKRASESHH